MLLPDDGSVICEDFKKSIDTLISNNKNTITLSNEYYVVQHISGDVYILIKTNSKDVFRKLDINNNQYVDISQIFKNNEKIAFASFFILKKNLIGFSNSLMSARIRSLAEIYNQAMFSRNNNHNITFKPITKNVTVQDVMQYAHVGKITMRMDHSQNIIQKLNTLLSGNVMYDDVDSFEIKIIPKRSKDIKDTFSKIMKVLPQEVTSVAVSAKEQIGDIATDLNVITSNTIYDFVNINSTIPIETQMENSYSNNSLLKLLGY